MEPENSELFVIAAYIAGIEDWVNFEEAWRIYNEMLAQQPDPFDPEYGA